MKDEGNEVAELLQLDCLPKGLHFCKSLRTCKVSTLLSPKQELWIRAVCQAMLLPLSHCTAQLYPSGLRQCTLSSWIPSPNQNPTRTPAVTLLIIPFLYWPKLCFNPNANPDLDHNLFYSPGANLCLESHLDSNRSPDTSMLLILTTLFICIYVVVIICKAFIHI